MDVTTLSAMTVQMLQTVHCNVPDGVNVLVRPETGFYRTLPWLTMWEAFVVRGNHRLIEIIFRPRSASIIDSARVTDHDEVDPLVVGLLRQLSDRGGMNVTVHNADEADFRDGACWTGLLRPPYNEAPGIAFSFVPGSLSDWRRNFLKNVALDDANLARLLACVIDGRRRSSPGALAATA